MRMLNDRSRTALTAAATPSSTLMPAVSTPIARAMSRYLAREGDSALYSIT